MHRHSSRLSWRGPRPGPIASTATGHRRSPATTWPALSSPSAMARRDCRWDSGCSGSPTGIATAPLRSRWPWRSAALVRGGGTLVTVVGPPESGPVDGLAVDFVVESDRLQLGEIVQRVRDGRVRTNIGDVAALDDAVAALNPTERRKGKTIISV